MKTKGGIRLAAIPISPNDDYMAGEDGNIYSRTKYKGFGRKEYVDWYPLSGRKNSKGYLTVSLSHDNKKVTGFVHRLVCMAFHGMPNPMTLQVRHLNGKRDDCRPSNLKWGTQVENWQDRREHGTASIGEKHWASKLTNDEREHLRWALQKGLCSQRQAARALGMSQSAIWSIANTKSE